MTDWTVTYDVTVVTLPYPPNDISENNSATTSAFNQNGDSPVLISEHPNERELTIQGFIYVPGASNSTIISTYLTPLSSMKGQEVTLGTPDGQYDGDWLLEAVSFRRVAEGAEVRYVYVLVFSQGSDVIVL